MASVALESRAVLFAVQTRLPDRLPTQRHLQLGQQRSHQIDRQHAAVPGRAGRASGAVRHRPAYAR
ncbi:MAG: hypothetical protein MZV65_13835 [Chromatiales bacterium]|nr:hypothetical protein [Chromatiales bacterium]